MGAYNTVEYDGLDKLELALSRWISVLIRDFEIYDIGDSEPEVLSLHIGYDEYRMKKDVIIYETPVHIVDMDVQIPGITDCDRVKVVYKQNEVTKVHYICDTGIAITIPLDNSDYSEYRSSYKKIIKLHRILENVPGVIYEFTGATKGKHYHNFDFEIDNVDYVHMARRIEDSIEDLHKGGHISKRKDLDFDVNLFEHRLMMRMHLLFNSFKDILKEHGMESILRD